MRFQFTWNLIVGLAISFVVAMSAMAQDAPSATTVAAAIPDAESTDWRFVFTPQAWVMSLSGDAEVQGNSADVDAGFIDVLRGSDSVLGLMGRLEAGRDKWTLFFDATYIQVGLDDVPTDAGEADFVSTSQWYEIGGAWRLCDKPTDDGGDPNQRFIAEVLGGARITNLDLEVDVSGVGDRQQDRTWVDPFIGGRIAYDFSKHWSATFRSDVGGFGVGSDFSWQVIATIGYRFELFSCPAYAFAGYRALAQDYEDGDFEWDVIAHGPLLGLTIKF